MPGLLKPDATCPRCGDPLDGIVDNTSSERVKRTYYHGKRHPKVRRMLPCHMTFTDYDVAQQERNGLEVHVPSGNDRATLNKPQ